MMVKYELDKLELPYTLIELGEVQITGVVSQEKLQALKFALVEIGLDLIDDKKTQLIEKIKNVITEMIHYDDELPRTNFSDYLSDKLHLDYPYMSNVFSQTKGITIEQYIMVHRIERVKELLSYDELTITEIAYKMNYSGISHLSNQFKKVTGITPSFYKALKSSNRISLEDL